MSDQPLPPELAPLARDYHTPPATPRAEIWRNIESARRRRPALRARLGGDRRWLVPAGLAALLLLAFGLGRLSVDAPAAPASVAGARAPSAAHRAVAAEYLGRTEAFLTDFRVSARRGQAGTSAPREAHRLLGTARLLLDSPAAEDVRLRALLEDLELVLAEIAQLRGEGRQDLDLITEGLDQRGTLGRLRAAVPAGGTPTSTQGVL